MNRPLFGARLRQLRRDRNLSLQEVSRGTAISVSFLSLAENDKTDITLGRLARLASFYSVHVSELLPRSDAGPTVIRSTELRQLESPSEGIQLHLLVPDSNRRMLPLIAEFEAGGHLAEWAQHEGEEYIYVLEGQIVLELEGEEPVVLGCGDGAYYRADRPHTFRAGDDGTARVFGVVSPPHL
jgi:transcriptional regulator with XRE-family HTH domain